MQNRPPMTTTRPLKRCYSAEDMMAANNKLEKERISPELISMLIFHANGGSLKIHAFPFVSDILLGDPGPADNRPTAGRGRGMRIQSQQVNKSHQNRDPKTPGTGKRTGKRH